MKLFAYYSRTTDGVWNSTEVEIYTCAEKDFERFYTVDSRSASRLQRLKDKKSLLCIDYEANDIQVYGSEASTNYGLIEIIYMPCNQKLTLPELNGLSDRIDPNCTTDLKSQVEYVTAPNWIIYHNQEEFRAEKYHDERIERYSTIINV